MWPELKIVHGKPRHSQSQGSVERANQDIENMLAVWMRENKTTKWSAGLKFIQFMKNRSLHSGIKQSPYKAMFGFDPKVGLSTTKLPSEVVQNIQTEDDLRSVLGNNGSYEDTTQQSIFNVEDSNDSPKENQPLASNVEDLNNSRQENQPSASNVEDLNNSRQENIFSARKRAAEGLELQAKRMKISSDKSHRPVEVGDNVTIPIPDVDKAKSDFRNVIGVVLEKKDELHRIGTRQGIINRLYCRSEFDKCKASFIDEQDVPQDETISLRSIATQESNTNGQGFTRCHCQTSCKTKRCLCRKKGLLCNSKCHSSSTCCNK
ncbi:uncharacterized protein LOC122503410 [Leptopilina heterotoma]|nr:uncharacterized protein LOC122499771 [Leptopilina heterotoma]XP_043469866.1 uncharacterized protein LOC122503410 [Leptopilina heterotoma]